MMSTEPSVEPPSSMKYSRLGYCWEMTDWMVCSRYFAELNTGVTRVIFGHPPRFTPSLSDPAVILRLPSHEGVYGCDWATRSSAPSRSSSTLDDSTQPLN